MKKILLIIMVGFISAQTVNDLSSKQKLQYDRNKLSMGNKIENIFKKIKESDDWYIIGIAHGIIIPQNSNNTFYGDVLHLRYKKIQWKLISGSYDSDNDFKAYALGYFQKVKNNNAINFWYYYFGEVISDDDEKKIIATSKPFSELSIQHASKKYFRFGIRFKIEIGYHWVYDDGKNHTSHLNFYSDALSTPSTPGNSESLFIKATMQLLSFGKNY